MKNLFKKVLYLLQQFDGIWSVPAAFSAFFFVGIILQSVFGYTTGIYDMGFIQPLFLAAAIVIGAANIAVVGILFTFRGLYRFLYGYKVDSHTINPAKQEWNNLKAHQKFAIAFGVFFLLMFAVIIVYLKLV